MIRPSPALLAATVAALALAVPASAKPVAPSQTGWLAAFLITQTFPGVVYIGNAAVVQTKAGWDFYATVRIAGGKAFRMKVCENKAGVPFAKGAMSNLSAGSASCDGMAHR